VSQRRWGTYRADAIVHSGLRCPPPDATARSEWVLWEGDLLRASLHPHLPVGFPLSFCPGIWEGARQRSPHELIHFWNSNGSMHCTSRCFKKDFPYTPVVGTWIRPAGWHGNPGYNY